MTGRYRLAIRSYIKLLFCTIANIYIYIYMIKKLKIQK